MPKKNQPKLDLRRSTRPPGSVKTSIRIAPDLWREAKKYAVDHDLELAEVVDRALALLLKKGKGRDVEANKEAR
jgi:hypothetical protein